MPSITATLKETFYLCFQNFWYLVVIYLATELPPLFLIKATSLQEPARSNVFIHIVIPAVFDLAQAVVIFILLKKTRAGFSLPAQSMFSEAVENAIKLSQVNFLAVTFFLLFYLPLAVILSLLGLVKKPWSGLVLTLTLFYFDTKFKVSSPMAVSEKLSTVEVMKRSWQLTKGSLF